MWKENCIATSERKIDSAILIGEQKSLYDE